MLKHSSILNSVKKFLSDLQILIIGFFPLMLSFNILKIQFCFEWIRNKPLPWTVCPSGQRFLFRLKTFSCKTFEVGASTQILVFEIISRGLHNFFVCSWTFFVLHTSARGFYQSSREFQTLRQTLSDHDRSKTLVYDSAGLLLKKLFQFFSFHFQECKMYFCLLVSCLYGTEYYLADVQKETWFQKGNEPFTKTKKIP